MIVFLETSPGVTGERKKELGFLFLRKSEKCLSLSGILNLSDSAIEEKKELEELETLKESEVTTPSISKEIGFADEEDLREIIIRIPCQIFLVFRV